MTALSGSAGQVLLLLLLSAAATSANAQPPPAPMPASMAASAAVGRKGSPPLTSAAAVVAADLQDAAPWDEDDALAELGDAVEIDDDEDVGDRLRRRAANEPTKSGESGGGGGGDCQLLMAGRDVRRRMSRSELRRLLGRLVKEHHAFHLPGKRVGGRGRPLCRYGKRGQWRPCSLHYKRLQSRRPYAYHWPIMNILGGALG
ncbi:hypothetical protein BOX15_Mlig021483g1 [Macrostomum lignano]|uniref:Uncharacterized protein n=1 Tax=Macrostomum lignano TaxID=282301 RepID=A0A267G302_9PLAT|nr:hypothetical protein BOX15_Mlig021483g1 [Macrostomum lignano]